MRGHRLRALSAGIAGVALLALLLGPFCPCLRPAGSGDHSCCAPQAGVRLADASCCGRDLAGERVTTAAMALVPQVVLAPAPQLAAPALVVAAYATPVGDRVAASPPSILRI